MSIISSNLLYGIVILMTVSLSKSALTQALNSDTLIQTQVVFRHGDRNPTKPYPTDPYIDEATYWPEGYGELTQQGRQQLFNLGVFLRETYGGVLNPRYSKFDISVTSSDKDRTIMSAQAALAGLYPPGKDTISWNSYIDWQLVPVHTIPRTNDSILHLKAPCPRFERDYQEFYETSDYVQNLEAAHMPMIKYLRFQMGLPENTPLSDLLTYQDTLMVQKQRGLEPPQWLNQSLYDELSSLRYFQYEVETYTPEFKRFKGGPILKEILENMRNSSGFAKTLYLYSGHEGTLGALMNTLGIFNHIPPPYAAALIFELHRKNSDKVDEDADKYFVEVYFRNETHRQPFKMETPLCSKPCSLEAFAKGTEPFVPIDWIQECELSVLKEVLYDKKQETFSVPAGIILFLTSLVILVFVVVSLRKISASRKSIPTETTPICNQRCP